MKGNHKKYKIYEIKKSNKLGVCVELKVVSVARKNNSKITGLDIRWRLDDMKKTYPELEEVIDFYPNPYKCDGLNKVSDLQMNPCGTCKLYEEEYIDYAKGVDNYE